MRAPRGIRIAIAMLVATAALSGTAGANQTTPGVTNNRVTVVLYNDFDVIGDLTIPWTESDETNDPLSTSRRYLVRTMKGLLRYFQLISETHGRTVHVIARPSASGLTTNCAGRRADGPRSPWT